MSKAAWSSGRSQQAEICRSTTSRSDGGPATFDAADDGDAVDERGDPVTVADEHVVSVQLERAIGKFSPPSEVVEHLLQTPVGPGDTVVAGNGPGDGRSQDLEESDARPAAIEVVLGPVQSVEEVDGALAVHGPVNTLSHLSLQ